MQTNFWVAQLSAPAVVKIPEKMKGPYLRQKDENTLFPCSEQISTFKHFEARYKTGMSQNGAQSRVVRTLYRNIFRFCKVPRPLQKPLLCRLCAQRAQRAPARSCDAARCNRLSVFLISTCNAAGAGLERAKCRQWPAREAFGPPQGVVRVHISGAECSAELPAEDLDGIGGRV